MSDLEIELDVVYHIDLHEFNVAGEDTTRFEQAAAWIAQCLSIHKLSVSVAIVDDETIQSLNAQQLGHDWPTDVISFEIDRIGKTVEGEVIASYETAARICSAAGWSAADELLLYVVHGMLHVVGLDDAEDQDRQRMRELERDCLIAVGVARAEEYHLRWDGIFNSEYSE